jgi:putative Holliday junction resolvase
MSQLVAFDHGTRRIGVAVADTEIGQAFSRPAIQVARGGDIGPVLDLARAERAERVIVGLPRNMDGSEGPQAAAARRFGGELERAGLNVTFVDERLTTWEAGENLGPKGARSRRKRGDLDSAAARLILQDYLDARRQQRTRVGAPDHQEAG